VSVQWRESLATGIEEIDNQHKELIRRIQKLFEACNQGRGRDEVKNIVKFLEDYVVTHFKAEEQLQQKYSYPEYNQHKAQHDKFIEDFQEFKCKLEQEGISTSSVIHINRMVVDWLIKHISNTDKAMGAFLKTKMQKQ